jgi:DNA primase
VLQIAAPGFKLQMVKRLAELAGVSQQEVEHLYEIRTQGARAVAPARGRRETVRSSTHRLLHLVALNPGLAPRLAIELFDAESAEGAAAHALIDWMREAGDRVPTPAMLFEHFRGSPVESLIAVGLAGAVYEKFDEDEMAGDFDALQKALRADRCLIELRELESRSRNASLSAEEGMKFMQLRRELEVLRRSQTDGS